MKRIYIVAESPLAVANYFIQKAASSGQPLTPMKVIKLVYIAHGWHLGLKGKPLITDQIEAWQYGPVIRELYHEFKKYGDSHVPPDAVPFWVQDLNDPHAKAFLDSVWNAYKGFSGVQLSTLTHQDGTPWDVTWNQQGGKNSRGAIIPSDLIESHYKEKARKN